MVDPGRVRRLLDRLGTEIGHLRRLSALDRGDLLADGDLLAGVKYRFVVAIEICIDAGEHVIASEGLRAPDTFADVFRILGEHGWVPAERQTQLESTARFRSLLVHHYADVDDARVVEILGSRLDDLDAFRRAIAERLVNES